MFQAVGFETEQKVTLLSPEMKKQLYYILTILIIALCMVSCHNQFDMKDISNITKWTDDSRKKYLANRDDSLSWDTLMFKNDLINLNPTSNLPLYHGVFPTSNYNLIDKESFKGVGNFGNIDYGKNVNGKHIIYQSFFVNKNIYNKSYLRALKNEVFFQIIVLTDFIDTVNYSHSSCEIVSRNHPDYFGQGYFKTINNKITYIAFITAERRSYAVINTRLFDLTYGKTILIAPQKNGSFRSMQIESPLLSSDSIDNFTDKLLDKKNIINFFSSVTNT